MRTTKASIAPPVRGRPGPRLPLPSYFCAISFRCQASKVSGVTMVAISARTLRAQALGLNGQAAPLVIVEPKSPIAELLAKNPVLLAQVVNDLQLALIHPPGNGDQQKTEWVENSLGLQSLLSRLRVDGEASRIHADPVSGPYEIGSDLALQHLVAPVADMFQ